MTAPNIVIAHTPRFALFGPAALERLRALGEVLNDEPISDWDAPGVGDLVADAEVIVGHWGCPMIDLGLVQRAPRLGMVAYAAGTIKGTVAPEVVERIRVTSGAIANAEPVAEYTLAMILLTNKDALVERGRERLTPAGASPRASTDRVGNWGKTVGVVGASLIGRRVIELLRAFPALPVRVYDPFLSPAEANDLGVTKVELDELCATCDVVSIHAPDIAATRHMIGDAQLRAMADGTTLINTARGRLLDHDALVGHADRLRIVLDVTDPEPLGPDHPLRHHPNVTLTPHLAGSQGSELERLGAYAVDEVERWIDGRPARHPITTDRLSITA